MGLYADQMVGTHSGVTAPAPVPSPSGSLLINPLFGSGQEDFAWDDFVKWNEQFQGKTIAELQQDPAFAEMLQVQEQQRQVGGGDSPDYETITRANWIDPRNQDIQYSLSLNPDGTVNRVKRDSLAALDRQRSASRLLGTALVGGIAGAGALGMFGGGSTAATGLTAAEGAAAAYGGAGGEFAGLTAANSFGGPLAGTAAGAAGAAAAPSLVSGGGGLSSLFGGSSNLWGAGADLLGGVLQRNQAEQAIDNQLATRMDSQQRLREGSFGALQQGQFTPYNFRLGDAQATVGPDGITATGGRDPFAAAQDLFGRHKEFTQGFRDADFEQLQQKLERQGLSGLQNAQGVNPYAQAMFAANAQEDARAFNDFLGTADSLQNSEVNRAAAAASGAAGGQNQSFNQLASLFNADASLEQSLIADHQQAIGADLNADSALLRSLSGLFNTTQEKK